MKKTWTLVALLASITMTAVTMATAAPRYHLTALGWLSSGNCSYAEAINEHGQVAGSGGTIPWSNEGFHACLWDAVSAPRDLDDLPPGVGRSCASGINDVGQVVGIRGTDSAFIWDQATGMQALGVLPGCATSQAIDLNNAGQVVGYCTASTTQGNRLPFIWDDAAGMRRLFGNSQTADAVAMAINERGDVVGGDYSSQYRAFLWTSDEGTRTLGVLPGELDSTANGINDLGQIVGTCGRRAFIWENGLMADLGTLTGYSWSTATGVNDLRQAVGWSYSLSQSERGFIWENGVLTDLNTLIDPALGWRITNPYAINDAGQIVGYGASPVTGYWQGFLLTPVPEPCSLAALLSGFSVLAAYVGRRR